MIKLKELIKLKEQAAPGAPAVPPAEPTTPTPDATAPGAAPEAPAQGTGEYDFTKDFKEFEDSVNKAKSDAKKKFLDKLNASVVGKKVTVNASRGYGQPQKDYTIPKTTKASVDWYYNKNVVVLTDENGKEYFLTPGVNIKIEGASTPEAPAEPVAEPGASTPGAAPSKPEEPAPSQAPSAAPEPSAAPSPEAPAAAAPEPAAPQPALPGQPENPEENPEDKDKLREFTKKRRTIKDIQSSLSEFLVNEKTDLSKFIKGPKTSIKESSKNRVLEFKMEVPKAEFHSKTDLKEMKLNLINGLRNRFQPSIHNVEIESVGKNYLFTIIKEIV